MVTIICTGCRLRSAFEPLDIRPRALTCQVMLRLTPILMAVAIGLGMYWFSAWRTNRSLDANSKPLDDPTLGALTQRLARALEVERIPVQIYGIDVVNGLASPDGRVFLTRGMIDKYRLGEITAEELTSVIAHELGHVALGHARKRMIDFTGQNVVRTMLAMVLGRFIPFFGIYIANFLSQILAARLSRNDEYEADQYAAALMTKAGLGVGPQISLFEKLDKLAPGGQAPAWLISHPRTEDRIAAIRQLDDQWNGAS